MSIQPQRAVLSVPASDPRKIIKALSTAADEVVVDLEDAVSIDAKDVARTNIATLVARGYGALAVRVNAAGTPWHDADVAACVENPSVTSIVVPKAESISALDDLARRLDELETTTARAVPLQVQALIESAAGVHHAVGLAAANDRVCALILGYADLAASMGRRMESSWQFAQDAVLLAARLSGTRAIDGPHLSIGDDAALARAAASAEALGFDGKWVIHPAQIDTVMRAFTPSEEEAAEASAIISALEMAAAAGQGAVQWRGMMLDEAVAVRARRVLQRTDRETHA